MSNEQKPAGKLAGKLAGKAAAITGGNQGIGKAIALEFAAQGANIFLMDRKAGTLPAAAAEVEALGVEAGHCELDVTQADGVEAAMEAVEERFGRIDILVNCAGVFQSHRFLEYPLERWKLLMDVNVTGTFLCCQSALRRMVPRGRGKVINLSSIAGRMGAPYRAAYYASKHAVIGLTRSVAMEMAEHGINVNAICPGMVDTDMFDTVLETVGPHVNAGDTEKLRAEMLKRVPLGRMIEKEEIAKLALYLASADSDGMTGQALVLSGGMVLA